MADRDGTDSEVSDLPFHEYCAHCHTQFDETNLNPAVTVVESDEGFTPYSFCDEQCLAEWGTSRE
jgi:hypothetical protein